MTASGRCCVCNTITNMFHATHTVPGEQAGNWYCEEHYPKSPNPMLKQLSRRERRALERKKAKR